MEWKKVVLCGIGAVQSVWGVLSFSPPVAVHRVSTEDVIDVKLAMHPTNYSAVALWIALASDSYQLEAASFDGSAWSSASLLGSSVTEPSIHVKIDENGYAIAIWSAFDGTDLTIQAAQFDGSIWSSAIAIQNLGTTEYDPLLNLAINNPGYAVASWLSPSLQLLGSTYSPNTLSWSPAYPISEEGIPLSATVTAPVLIDPDNQLTAFLPLAEEMDVSIFDALSPPTKPVNTYVRLISAEATSPDLSANQIGGAAFLVQDTTRHYIISGIRAGSATWNFLLAAHPGAPVQNLTVALNPLNARAGGAWESAGGEIQAAFYNVVSWQFVYTLSYQGTSPALSFYEDTADHFAVIWDDQTVGPEGHAIYFSEYNTGASATGWSSPVSLSEPSTYADKTQLASLPTGETIAMWIRLDSTLNPVPRQILESALGAPAGH
ncbi:MAG: hypothetical protein WCF19_03120 [Chlamydiales bacterium]